jgi:hypothetical protein
MTVHWTGFGNSSFYSWMLKSLEKKVYGGVGFHYYRSNEASIILTL